MMHHPEAELGPGVQGNLIERLIRTLQKIFKKKSELEELEESAVEAQQYHIQHETKAHWQEEERNKRVRDAGRSYHDVKSAQMEEDLAQVARSERAEAILQKLRETASNADTGDPSADYIARIIRDERNVLPALEHLVAESPAAADVLNNLLTKGKPLHADSRALMKEAQLLVFEAQRTGDYPQLFPLLSTIQQRVLEIIPTEYELTRKSAGRGVVPHSNLAEFIQEKTGIVMTEADRQVLSHIEVIPGTDREDKERTWEAWDRVVADMVVNPRAPDPNSTAEVIRTRNLATPQNRVAIKSLVAPIDRIWAEIESKESAGSLNSSDLEDYVKQIRRVEANILPKDVAPGSDAWMSAVRQVEDYTREKIDLLVEKYKTRLKVEKPTVRSGITDPKEFLKQMVLDKSRLGLLFDQNKAMYDLFIGISDESRKFRDQVFLKIHSAILSDQRNSSRDNFGLYQSADFSTFIDILHIELASFTDRKTGRRLSEVLSDHYNNLSNTIRQCRDIDFYASQPTANSDLFTKSLGMFQNEYVKEAFNIPAVSVAFRAYETVLRSIMASNDGYIPPALIEYNPSYRGSFWDAQSLSMLEKDIKLGVIPDVQRDEKNYFLHKLDPDNQTVSMDFSKPLKPDEVSEDERRLYMTLAKGMGVAFARYLEMFAASRVPGSEQPGKGIERFHSMPYENMAKAMNYFNVFIHKWHIGAYKYFHLMNLLVPDGKKMKIDPSDSTEAIRAFMAYQDGTFEEKYGADAKRFIDLFNFSGCSSALGKDTKWRQYDSTVKWSDQMREFLGGGTQLILSRRYAEEKVKEFFIIGPFKKKYREELIRKNEAQPDPRYHLPTSGSGFDKLWREYGYENYRAEIDKLWDKFKGKDPLRGRDHHKAEEAEELIGLYQRAFEARVWVEMAMRNPLVVAHNLKIDVPLVGLDGKTKKMTLHNMLVQDILGIPPEDTKYAEAWGKSADYTSPNKDQERYMLNVLNLEGDLAAVREKAISGVKGDLERGNRVDDLTEADFEIIDDPVRKQHALEYWRKVRLVILGDESLDTARRLYDDFGLALMENQENYEWDFEKIKRINETIDALEGRLNRYEAGRLVSGVTTIASQEGSSIPIPFLLKKALNTKFDWIIGTDDMALGRMDLLDLGSRQLLRRGGDIAAHEAGGNAVTEYLMHGLLATYDKHRLWELLEKIKSAYSGDMIETGWSVVENLAYMTCRLLSWDTKRLGSAAQIDVMHTRRNVPAWRANERREWWDIGEHMDVIPPDSYGYQYDVDEKVNIHHAREETHATNKDVWVEIIALGLLLATLVNLYRAFTAKSEEEEGGGGGGHH